MLKFSSDNKFKIMQITDIQEIPNVSSDTLNLLNSALDKKGGGYEPVSKDQIEWYKNKRDSLKQNDKFVPSFTGNYGCR